MYGPCMGKNGGSLNGSLSKALFRLRLRSFHPRALPCCLVHSFDDDDLLLEYVYSFDSMMMIHSIDDDSIHSID